MPISLACPSCRTSLTIRAESAGRSVKCPKCQKAFVATLPAETAKPKLQPARGKAVSPPPKVFTVGEDAIVEEEEVVVGEDAVVDADAGPVLPPPSFESLAEPVPEKMQADILAFVAKGEKLLWLGQPSRALMASGSWIAVPFGMLFAAIGIGVCIGGVSFMAQKDVSIAAPLIMFGFGGIFACTGLFFCFMPLFIKKFKGKRQCYVLTDRRAIICTSIFGRSDFETFTATQLRQMTRQMNGRVKGAGSLVFQVSHLGYDAHGHAMNQSVGFLHIHDIKKIEELLKRTLPIDQ